jgi:hypothetical protein
VIARDNSGQRLNAEFDVEVHDSGAFITFHARYGTRGSGREVNIDYLRALEVVLARLGSLSAIITAIEVDSRVARDLALEKRLLALPYPLRLTIDTDADRLRRDITEAQRKVARDAKARPTGGNNSKRIRISLTFPTRIDFNGLQRALTGELRTMVGGAGGALARPATPSSFVPYREAVPATVSPAEEFSVDSESVERALAGHAFVQNALADHLRSHGLAPVSPGNSGPDFDLGWQGAQFTVAEIKSLNGSNIERQLRIGLGQVLQYRTSLSTIVGVTKGVLAVEHAVDQLWLDVCASVGVVLTWPPDWPGLKIAANISSGERSASQHADAPQEGQS